MSAIDPRQLVLILVVLTVLKSLVLAQSYLKLIYLTVEVVNDIFVLTDMKSH